jgi:ribosomal protein S18 acetylase RimI-like enzyme
MSVRRFIKGADDFAWSSLAGIELAEFRGSLLDPEFSDEGMLVGEVDGRIAGISNAHISPTHPSFCVLRNFRVKEEHWEALALLLLDSALDSFTMRNAHSVEAVFPETEKRHISLLQNNGFEATRTDCKMRHDLRANPAAGNPEIRIAQYSDVKNPELVVNLQNEVFRGLTGRPVTKEELLHWMKNMDFECFIAFSDGLAVASSFCEIKQVEGKKHGWIYGLGVLPAFRRKKIGTALLAAILNYLKARRANVVFLETDYGSYEQRFYESAGFQVDSRLVCLRKDLFPQTQE